MTWLIVSSNTIHWSCAVRTECRSSGAEVDANVRRPVGEEGSEGCSWHWWAANWQSIMSQQVQQTIHNWLTHQVRSQKPMRTRYQVHCRGWTHNHLETNRFRLTSTRLLWGMADLGGHRWRWDEPLIQGICGHGGWVYADKEVGQVRFRSRWL